MSQWKAMPGPANTWVIVDGAARNVAYISHVMPSDLRKMEAAEDLLAACRAARNLLTRIDSHGITQAKMSAALDVVIAKAGPQAMKDLGWENNWLEDPPEVVACRKAGHKTSDDDVGPPHRGMEHIVRCLDGCDYVYRYDSSD